MSLVFIHFFMKKAIGLNVLAVAVGLAAGFLYILGSCSHGHSRVQDDDAGMLDSLRVIWNESGRTGKYDSAISVTSRYYRQALKEKDTVSASYAGLFLAQAYLYKEYRDSVDYFLKEVSGYVDSDMYPSLGIPFYNIKGISALKYGLDYSEAMDCFRKGYECAKNDGNADNMVVFLTNIVEIFYLRSDSNGLSYAEEACAIADGENVSRALSCQAHIAFTRMLFLKKEYSEALAHLRRAEKIMDELSLSSQKPAVCLLYGDILSSLGRTDEADAYYRQALEFSDIAEPAMITMIYLNYGNFCLSQGRTDDAIAMFKSGLSVSYKYGNNDFRKSLIRKISETYYLTGDRNASLDYFINYHLYMDSISNINAEQQFNNLLMRYQDIEHERSLQAKEVIILKTRKNMMLSVFIVFTMCLVSLFILLLYRKQKKMYALLVERYQKYADRMEVQKESAADDDSRILYDRIERLMREEKLYMSKDISMDKIAEMLQTNRTYVSNCINQYSGMTYYAYLDAYRIREATRLISNESREMPLKELSDRLGYSSISVFYKAFKRETGCTPGQYRNEIKRKKQDR